MTEPRSATTRRIVGLILSLVGWNAIFVLSGAATVGAALAGPRAMLVVAAAAGVVTFAQLVDLAFVEVRPRMRAVLLVSSVLAFFLTPGVAALLLRIFVIEAYLIPSESMIPALEQGDLVLVNKLAGARTVPQRGDIIVFELPSDRSKTYVKRVAGIPEDRIEIVEDLLHVNGSQRRAFRPRGQSSQLTGQQPIGLHGSVRSCEGPAPLRPLVARSLREPDAIRSSRPTGPLRSR